MSECRLLASLSLYIVEVGLSLIASKILSCQSLSVCMCVYSSTQLWGTFSFSLGASLSLISSLLSAEQKFFREECTYTDGDSNISNDNHDNNSKVPVCLCRRLQCPVSSKYSSNSMLML